MTKELDNCEICKGAKGGVKGNENIVDNIVMCDYCTVEYQNEKNRNPYITEHKNGWLRAVNIFALIVVLACVGWILYSMYEIHTLQLLMQERSYHIHRGQLLEWRNQADDQEIMYHWRGGVPNTTDKTYFHDVVAIGDQASFLENTGTDNVAIGYDALNPSKEKPKLSHTNPPSPVFGHALIK